MVVALAQAQQPEVHRVQGRERCGVVPASQQESQQCHLHLLGWVLAQSWEALG